jgi:citrate lyase subunit beta-like protein
VVRVNGFPSGRTESDLAAVLPAHPDAILLPKVSSPAQIQRINEILVAAESQQGWTPQSITLIAIVESARGMIVLDSICQQSERFPRFQAVVFGAEDFTADMGATRTSEATELLYARSRLVMFCAAYGLQAIDLVTVNFKDETILEKESTQGAQLGYAGKQIIHPAQIAPVQRIFTPSEKEIEWAKQIITFARQYSQEGKGAFVYEGQMVDAPVIKRAELILARAQVEVN